MENQGRSQRIGIGVFASAQGVSTEAGGEFDAGEVFSVPSGPAVSLGHEFPGVTGDTLIECGGKLTFAKVEGPRMCGKIGEFLSVAQVLVKESEAFGIGGMASEPLVELGEVSDDGLVVDGASDVSTVEINEDDAGPLGVRQLHEQVASVHVGMFKSTLMGTGDESCDGIGEGVNGVFAAFSVSVGGKLQPDFAQRADGFDLFGDQEARAGESFEGQVGVGDGLDGVDAVFLGVSGDPPFGFACRATPELFDGIGSGGGSVGLDEKGPVPDPEAMDIPDGISFDEGRVRLVGEAKPVRCIRREEGIDIRSEDMKAQVGDAPHDRLIGRYAVKWGCNRNGLSHAENVRERRLGKTAAP